MDITLLSPAEKQSYLGEEPNWQGLVCCTLNTYMDLSIFCTLSTTELQERKTTILASLRNAVLSRTRIPEGYRYQFASHSTTLQDVARMIELERECCRFLNFAVTESEKIVQLDVTGQTEALAIIEDLFG